MPIASNIAVPCLYCTAPRSERATYSLNLHDSETPGETA
jgi:hypothetical protein